MEKRNNYYKTALWMLTGVFLLTGCSDNHGTAEGVLSEEKAAFQRESVSPEVERILAEAEEDEPEAFLGGGERRDYRRCDRNPGDN